MVETYGAHGCRVYYAEEIAYGQTPANPTMVGVNTQGVEPELDPNLVKVRGVGWGSESTSLKSNYLPNL